jgi:hypothetical protein
VWSTGVLDPGYHTVKIVRSPSSATGKYINLDRVDVAGSLVTNTRVEQISTTAYDGAGAPGSEPWYWPMQ